MKKLVLLCSAAAVLPTAAFAQSTGTQDFEQEQEEAIVVTGTRTQEVGGVVAPDTSKAKAVLTQEFIARQNPGQTVLDTINTIPGVSFTNNDAYGSSGGGLTIRGFDSSRISLTFDGIPLNDSGNYAIYSNQQIDPELIEQVNVNLGTTDVDSPTASAVGGTVNLRTRNPNKEFGVHVVGSLGEFDFRRIFAVVDTGEIGPWGTRAFFSASTAKNDNPFNNYGKVDKQQYNAKIYQPLGTNGDFVAISGHYNQNRNNFFGSLRLRNDLTRGGTNPSTAFLPRNVGSGNNDRFPRNNDEREYDINYPCEVDVPVTGTIDSTTTCGTEFDRRYNPSNTGNIKGSSRFSITDALTLTVEPSFQYVKANGGGTVTGREGFRRIGGVDYTGFIGGQYYFGRDLNGDGDTLDTCSTTGASCSSSNFNGVTLVAPSQTRTYRVGLITGLRYDINDHHTVRVGYTWDRANHRQTGQVGLVAADGEPLDVFPINDPLKDVRGNDVQKRDRQSYAILHQLYGEYRGEFMDERLVVNAGLRAPFFTRDLENFCFTTSASGFIDCFNDPAQEASYAAANPYSYDPETGQVSGYAPPGHRKLKYNALLPNIGFVFDITPAVSAFGNYAKGISVPSTDNLYNAFYYPEDTKLAKPDPETTDSFDLGLRYRSSKVQAQVGVWKTYFKNRTASAYDPVVERTVFRNLGSVDKWGIDASVAWAPVRALTLYGFASWNDSDIKDNIQVGALPAGTTCDTIDRTLPLAYQSCAFTAGKREAGAPTYNWGFSALTHIGPFDVGLTGKKTGPRYIFDNNAAVFRGDVDLAPGALGSAERVYSATAPAYWLFNLDARWNFKVRGLRETYFQLNVYNLFDELYVGNYTSNLNQAVNSSGVYDNPPFAQIGAPRTVSGTLSIAF